MMRRVALCLLLCLVAAEPSPAQAPAPAASAAPAAEAFRARAAAANAAEVEASRLALSRSSNARVRSFARRVIREQAAAARALGGAAPQADPRRAAMVAELTPLRGRAFDLAYARIQTEVLEQAISLHEAYAGGGADPQLRAFARATLPRLQQQLAFARRLSDTAAR